ncbi:GNAT family N-acetyltransferase [Arcobacter sp. FWKO B]|uniref:GNAT family N-acetyltransferase n=1 Tax=Arcobacter sp. FWKO B TaxID=2593672 RepID=UPI0018A5814D|nr:GNAT family N-acetyltransferase [Arcobacter sp. FWKO B]QOG11784.1 GNAT family N-acetyltransferase [Arcobacter sp. FWKO B]
MYIIRSAKPADAHQVVGMLIEAMGDTAYYLAGTKNDMLMKNIINSYFLSHYSRISYKNCTIVEKNGDICAVMASYEGKFAKEYDEWISEQIFKNSQRRIEIDKECFDDEYYIDCICVSDEYRGKKISSLLFKYAIDKANELKYKKVSLVVDCEKKHTKQYYEKLGFKDNIDLKINNHSYHHMIKVLVTDDK